MSETNSSDWEISKLYSKSWEIVKNNKVTWIFGAAVASLAGGSYNFRSSGGDFNPDSLQKIFNKDVPQSEQISQVLGASVNPLTDLFSQIIQSIPVYYYVIFVLEVIFMVIVGIIIRYVYSAWSHASLIESVNSAYHNKKPTIADSSKKGFSNIKSFILLEIIPFLFFLIVIPVSLIVFALAFSIDNLPLKILLGLLVVVEICFLIYASVMMSLALVWGYREVVVSHKSGKAAFWDGLKIARKKVWGSIGLALLNTIVSIIISAIPLLIVIAIVGAGVFTYFSTETVPPYIIAGGVIATIIYIPLSIVLGAVIQAFKASVWTIAYNQIKGKYTNDT